jgi:RNA polymerase sigma factor (sigma-70 family)
MSHPEKSEINSQSPLVELVGLARAGQERAWRELVRRHERLVWAVVRAAHLPPADAADTVQHTWLRLAEQLTALREPECLPGWLRTTARREALRARAARRREVPLRDLPAGVPPLGGVLREPADPEELALRADRDQRVRQVCATLPEHCRTLLRLLADHPRPSHADLAAALGVSPTSVGRYRARCLAELRRHLPPTDLHP